MYFLPYFHDYFTNSCASLLIICIPEVIQPNPFRAQLHNQTSIQVILSDYVLVFSMPFEVKSQTNPTLKS